MENTCLNQIYLVVEQDHYSEDLQPSFPFNLLCDSLKYFPKLQSFNLLISKQGLDFKGEKTEEIYEIQKLKEQLNLSNIRLEAFKCLNPIMFDKTDLSSFFLLDQIESVSFCIKKDQITDEEINSFKIGFNRVTTNLQTMRINICQNCLVNSQASVQLGKLIYSLQSVASMSLRLDQYNNVDEKGLFSICTGIKNLINLLNLQITIHDNQINQKGAIYIGDALKNLINLNSLNLHIGNNDIRQEGAIGVADGLKYLTNLTRFIIRIDKGNNIGQQGAIQIGQGIKTLENLNQLTLNIDTNQIGEVGAQGIGQGFKYLSQLNKLSFNIGLQNQIYTKGAIGLINGLQQLKNLLFLEIIILGGNYIGLDSIKKLVENFKNVQFLNNIQFKIQEAKQFEIFLKNQALKKVKRLVQISKVQL